MSEVTSKDMGKDGQKFSNSHPLSFSPDEVRTRNLDNAPITSFLHDDRPLAIFPRKAPSSDPAFADANSNLPVESDAKRPPSEPAKEHNHCVQFMENLSKVDRSNKVTQSARKNIPQR